MIFAILTLFAALMLAGVADWFAVIGIMSIYAGAPFHAALIMGVVLAIAKLVTTSWLYRNWDYSKWTLKAPLIYFMLALMVATSIGVFGFLTKSHLEQGAATIDNTAKVERLDQQIAREKSVIADNEKIINQLDAAINSYLGKDNADKALNIRKAQAGQRKQLRTDIDASQKQIDKLSDEKFQLQSQVRALQLEVGPIKYIAELFNTDGDEKTKIETAVKFFTLLIVSTLDPLAIILLIAANHTLLRLQNEKKVISENKTPSTVVDVPDTDQEKNTTMSGNIDSENNSNIDSANKYEGPRPADSPIVEEATVYEEILTPAVEIAEEKVNEEEKSLETLQTGEVDTPCAPDIPQTEILQDVSEIHEKEDQGSNLLQYAATEEVEDTSVEQSPAFQLNAEITPTVEKLLPSHNSAVLRELMPTQFIQEMINELKTAPSSESISVQAKTEEIKQNNTPVVEETDKYPKHYSWLKEFKGN